MTDLKIHGEALPNIPWQERPIGNPDALGRYAGNPVVAARAIRASTYIHNSAVIPFQGAFAGVFRIDNRARRMQLHVGHSDDGLAWRIDEAPTRFQCSTNPGRSSRGRIVVFVRDNARRG